VAAPISLAQAQCSQNLLAPGRRVGAAIRAFPHRRGVHSAFNWPREPRRPARTTRSRTGVRTHTGQERIGGFPNGFNRFVDAIGLDVSLDPIGPCGARGQLGARPSNYPCGRNCPAGPLRLPAARTLCRLSAVPAIRPPEYRPAPLRPRRRTPYPALSPIPARLVMPPTTSLRGFPSAAHSAS